MSYTMRELIERCRGLAADANLDESAPVVSEEASDKVYEKEAREAVKLLDDTISELKDQAKHLRNSTGWGVFPMNMAIDKMKESARDLEKIYKKAQSKIKKAAGK